MGKNILRLLKLKQSGTFTVEIVTIFNDSKFGQQGKEFNMKSSELHT